MDAVVRTKEVGNILDKWWKVLAVVAMAISSCFGAYYKILGHDNDIVYLKSQMKNLEERHEKDILSLQESYKRQYSVMEEKSNQKFEQGMKVAIDLKTTIDKIEVRLNQEEQKTSYSTAWRDAEKFYKNK